MILVFRFFILLVLVGCDKNEDSVNEDTGPALPSGYCNC
jgi:hypothetical protein